MILTVFLEIVVAPVDHFIPNLLDLTRLSVDDNLYVCEGFCDPSQDTLLDLDGQILVIDPAGRHWVKFSVKRVPVTPEKPHGLDYALTLHGPDGQRLVGFDNAHSVRSTSGPGGRSRGPNDHRHRNRTVRCYDYMDAATLLADFWAEVEAVLVERGVKL